MNQIDKVEAVKQQILAGSERLGLEDRFQFGCHPGVSCFNQCCGDVNIFLTPYDVLRLKSRLGLSSGEFLERHTLRPFTADQKLPVVVLKMDDSQPGKPCPLVSAAGCTVYEDRPWPCRMYPLGVASAKSEANPDGLEFYFLMHEDPCEGFKHGTTFTVREWMDSQGVTEYNRVGELFKELNLHPALLGDRVLNPQQMQMYYTACYDLDRFRAFVFESSFLSKYHVEPDVVAALRASDEALLEFAFRWLRTCLFGDKEIPLKQEVAAQYRDRLVAQGARLETR